MSKTLCILPWIHMYVNADGSVLPCCIGDYKQPLGNTHNRSIEDIWNSHEYKTLRKQLLNGEKPSICNQCWKHEEAGNTSSRMSNNKRFKEELKFIETTNEDGSLDEMNLRYFDVRWSNICNFKCRTCSSTYSSSWAQEDNSTKFAPEKPVYIFAGGNNNDNLYQQFKPHFKNIKVFYFAGGEPLLTDKHYDILEHLIETGNTKVRLEYNSNVSKLKYKKKSIIDLWNQFEDVQVSASLDSYGPRAEYIRAGTDWNLITTNLKVIREQVPHVKISFNTVVSIFNLCTLTDFLNEIQNVDPNSASMYNIVDPHYYSVNALPEEYKTIALEKIQKYMNSNPGKYKWQLEGVVRYIENSKFDESALKQFRAKTQHYDFIRNQKFIETFPELKSVL